jgi:hypothetical protein
MAESSSMWGRMFARLQGEVSGAALEAYRRASLPVFELMDRVEARRDACIADGLNLWTIPPATRAEFLCAWNAFVLQTLGNDILNADYTEYPDTAGFVPPVTADQLLSFFGQVEGWMDRAQQAHANPDYRLDVRVPAALPPWSEVEPNPASHLRGLLKAMRAVGEHAAAGMRFLPETVPEGPEQAARQRQIHRIRQLYASAQSKARYAADLHGANPPPDVRERVEPYAREAIELFYELGQLIADPALGGGAADPSAPLPGQPGFDVWCLTYPPARRQRAGDAQALAAVTRMWHEDPDPARTLNLHAEILDALDRGAVANARDRWGDLGHFHRCPWGPVYAAQEPVMLGSRRIQKGQGFTVEVLAEPTKEGELSARRLLVGRFERVPGQAFGARYVAPRS